MIPLLYQLSYTAIGRQRLATRPSPVKAGTPRTPR